MQQPARGVGPGPQAHAPWTAGHPSRGRGAAYRPGCPQVTREGDNREMSPLRNGLESHGQISGLHLKGARKPRGRERLEGGGRGVRS